MNFNKSVLGGRLTSDPEVRVVGDGFSIASFSVAVNDRVKKGGQWEDEASYFDCEAFGSVAERIQRFFTKGSEILLDCKPKQERWTDKDGKNRSKIVFKVSDFEFVGGRSGSSEAPKKDVQHAAAAASDGDIPF